MNKLMLFIKALLSAVLGGAAVAIVASYAAKMVIDFMIKMAVYESSEYSEMKAQSLTVTFDVLLGVALMAGILFAIYTFITLFKRWVVESPRHA